MQIVAMRHMHSKTGKVMTVTWSEKQNKDMGERKAKFIVLWTMVHFSEGFNELSFVGLFVFPWDCLECIIIGFNGGKLF